MKLFAPLLLAACATDQATTSDPIEPEPIAWNAPYCYSLRDSEIVALDFQTETLTPVAGLPKLGAVGPSVRSLAVFGNRFVTCGPAGLHFVGPGQATAQFVGVDDAACLAAAGDVTRMFVASFSTVQEFAFAHGANGLGAPIRYLPSFYVDSLGMSADGNLLGVTGPYLRHYDVATQTTTNSGLELGNTFGIAERGDELAVVDWQGITIHDAATGTTKATRFANEHLRGLSCHDTVPPVL